jgi:hypothetical protein
MAVRLDPMCVLVRLDRWCPPADRRHPAAVGRALGVPVVATDGDLAVVPARSAADAAHACAALGRRGLRGLWADGTGRRDAHSCWLDLAVVVAGQPAVAADWLRLTHDGRAWFSPPHAPVPEPDDPPAPAAAPLPGSGSDVPARPPHAVSPLVDRARRWPRLAPGDPLPAAHLPRFADTALVRSPGGLPAATDAPPHEATLWVHGSDRVLTLCRGVPRGRAGGETPLARLDLLTGSRHPPRDPAALAARVQRVLAVADAYGYDAVHLRTGAFGGGRAGDAAAAAWIARALAGPFHGRFREVALPGSARPDLRPATAPPRAAATSVAPG